MAMYKYQKFIKQSTSEEFDKLHKPGINAPFAGIYRCNGCGHEIGIAEGHTLPPQTHAQHPQHLPIQWQLAVYAAHNK